MPELVKEKLKYGLLHSLFWPIASEPEGQHPIYGPEITLGSAVRDYLTLNYSEAKAYGDDSTRISVREFVDGTAEIETLLSDLEVDSQLYGSSYEGGVLTDNINDSANPGGHGFVQKLKTRTGTIYRAVFLYYIMPSQNADNADTKGASITFANNSVTATVQADKTGAWRVRADFGTEAEALAFLRGLVAASAGGAFALVVEEPRGGEVKCYTRFVTAGETGTVEFDAVPTAIFDNAVSKSASGTSYSITGMNADHTIVAFFAA